MVQDMNLHIYENYNVKSVGFYSSYKVDEHDSNTSIIRPFVFEWYVVRCGSKNKHQKDTGP